MNTNQVRQTYSHVIEYRNPVSLHNGKAVIASIYIDGRFEYDTMKNPWEALDAADELCNQIDTL